MAERAKYSKDCEAHVLKPIRVHKQKNVKYLIQFAFYFYYFKNKVVYRIKCFDCSLILLSYYHFKGNQRL